MLIRGREYHKMPCESCAVQFSVFRRKRACSECERYYCSGCLRRGGGTMCAPCRVISTRPLSRQTIAHLKVRDLQCFLQKQNISTRGCVEKEELVSLCVSHVNSASYRRRGPRSNTNPFSTLKGITNNINIFINSAFDIRPGQAPTPAPSNCYNASQASARRTTVRSPQDGGHTIPDRRFTTRPGGEADIEVVLPSPPSPSGGGSEATLVDTNDCYEIEDVDEVGWEFVNRPADPLPNDSETLLASASPETLGAPHTPVRASSELELRLASIEDLDASPPVSYGIRSRRPSIEELDTSPQDVINSRPLSTHGASSSSGSADTIGIHEDLPSTYSTPDSEDGGRSSRRGSRTRPRATSEQDLHYEPPTGTPHHMTLDQMKRVTDLELLNVKQLKELLTRNRVDYRGCVERRDLLERARMLWRDHVKYKNEVDNLPLEECCKICMAAPLECVLLECGHIAACTNCSKQLAECPICRQYIVRAVRFFRS